MKYVNHKGGLIKINMFRMSYAPFSGHKGFKKTVSRVKSNNVTVLYPRTAEPPVFYNLMTAVVRSVIFTRPQGP